MQDFYILQRTETPLNVDQARKWYYTVDMLAPEGVLAGDDSSNLLMLGIQGVEYLYIIPLIRHLEEGEAEKIVEGYMRVTEHDFDIEASNVYRADADFGHPFEYDIRMDETARNIIHENLARHNHNIWIQEKQNKGWRYGLNLDINERTHPAMRPWDDLPESYRRLHEVDDKELLDYYAKNKNSF